MDKAEGVICVIFACTRALYMCEGLPERFPAATLSWLAAVLSGGYSGCCLHAGFMNILLLLNIAYGVDNAESR